MKRRDFIKASTAAGVTGFVGAHSALAKKANEKFSGPGFDVHPFIKEHPEAVFIYKTSVDSKKDIDKIESAGLKLSKELIVKTDSAGYSNSTRITLKANFTCAGPKDGHAVFEKLGVNTDPNFVAGWVQGMRETGPQEYYLRECACPDAWDDMGWTAMAEKNGIDFRDLSSKHYYELEKGDLNFVKVPKGVV
ncbi:MAG: twin-arginine translocation signal domain-containing protein, partial [Candidatus Latescibacteria bacterium]|nr:twin-arginine translocation signal domain-containing protein [Candidatus Latescibacterota bacterium]